jgi:hypothetical protein
MGFGEDFEKLHSVLVQHKMDVAASAEALVAQA